MAQESPKPWVSRAPVRTDAALWTRLVQLLQVHAFDSRGLLSAGLHALQRFISFMVRSKRGDLSKGNEP